MPPVAQAAAGTAASPVDTSDSCMRRVASAPALTHASCYPEVSPTAAVAAAAAAAPPTATRSPHRSKPGQHAVQGTSQPCSSCNRRRCSCLEVYVVSRSFSEFAGPVMKRLHPHTKEHLVDIGICHFMTVFKTTDGQLVQFDFGPLGGDVQKAHGPLATFLRRARAAAQQQQQHQQQLGIAGAVDAATAASAASTPASTSNNHSSSVDTPDDHSSSNGRGMVHSVSAPSLPMASLDLASRGGGEAAAARMQGNSNRPRRGVVGEIRERRLQALPSSCLYMGRTALTIEDIRMYNAAQGRQTYTLHENDCRHYVNSLVQYTTGVERSTQHLKRHYFYTRHADTWLWYGWLIAAAQLVTDVGNWSHIQAGTAATLLAVTGRSTLSSLKTLATPMLPALKSIPALLPAATAAAAAASPAAAAAGSSTGTAIEGLVTTLKLPATLLLKRPLAAGAAAGGAGAAAAVLREPANDSSAGSASAPHRTWAAISRPLRVVGDGMSHGFRTAVMGVQRLALGPNKLRPQQELQMATQAAFASAVPAAGLQAHPWHRSGFGEQQATGLLGGFMRRAHLLQPFARPGPSNNWQQQQQDGTQSHGSPMRPFGQVRLHISRQVMWLGSAAASAPGQLALLAMGGRGLTAAASSAVPTSLSSDLQRQQEQQPVAAGLGQRQGQPSTPNLLLPGPGAAPEAVTSGVDNTSRPGGGFQTCAGPLLCTAGTASSAGSVSSSGGSGGGNASAAGVSDMTFVWDFSRDDGNSSLCNAFSSSSSRRRSGAGRQVLNLPTPRLSWGQRASQAMIVRQ